MAESLTVANSALIHVGAKLITALAGTEKEARYCNERIGKIRKALLRMHPWNFAIKRALLTITYGTITGAANNGAGLIRITQTAHGYVTGDSVRIDQVVGTTEANSLWVVTLITANTYDLVASTFTNTYVSGGRSVKAPPFGWAYQHALPSDFLKLISIDENSDTEWELENRLILADSDEIELRYVYNLDDDTKMDDLFLQAFALLLAWDLCIVTSQSESRRAELWGEFRQMAARARFNDAVENPAKMIEANDWVDAHFGRASKFVRDPMTS